MMRYIVFFLLMSLFYIPASQAQRVRWSGEKHNAWSIDFQPAALDIPISPIQEVDEVKSRALGYGAQLGVRYMFSHHLGVRPHYGYHRFYALDESGGVLSLQRAGVELVGNLSEFFPFQGDQYFRRFNALVHAGGGITWGLSNTHSKDGMGSLMLGVSPQYRINWRLAVFADVTGQATVLQNIAYDGQQLWDGDGKSRNTHGFFMSMGVGLHYYFGPQARHTDWR